MANRIIREPMTVREFYRRATELYGRDESFEAVLTPVDWVNPDGPVLRFYKKFANRQELDDWMEEFVVEQKVSGSMGNDMIERIAVPEINTIFFVETFNVGQTTNAEEHCYDFDIGELRLKLLNPKSLGENLCFESCFRRVVRRKGKSMLDSPTLEQAENLLCRYTKESARRTDRRQHVAIWTPDTLDPEKVERHDLFLYEGHYRVIESVRLKSLPEPSEKARATPENINTQEYKKARSLLFYDIETVINYDKPFQYKDEGVMKTGHPLKARLLAYNYTVDGVQWYTGYYYGYDCVERFLMFLRNSPDHFHVYAHNGARFDHYFVVSGMGDLPNRKIRLRGKDIVKVLYYGHSFKDTAKLLPFPLKRLCEDFKPEVEKISRFDHLGVSSYELCTLSDDKMTGDYLEAYIAYCVADTIALRMIYMKFRETVFDIDERTDILDTSTIGTLAVELLKPAQRKAIRLAKFIDNDQVKNRFVRRAIVGGISYSRANRERRPYSTTESITGVDINSQYPASLIIGRYPCGQSRWCYDREEALSQSSFGFVEISNLVFKNPSAIQIVPTSEGSSRQWWNKEGRIEEKVVLDLDFLDYLDLESFQFHRGLITNQVMNGREAYKPRLMRLYKIKMEQDDLKAQKFPEYNCALRTVVKTVLASFYGKQIEDYGKYSTICWNSEGNKKTIFGNSYSMVKEDKINNMAAVGAIILSVSKVMLNEYMKMLADPNDVFLIETDGYYYPSRYHDQHAEAIDNHEVNWNMANRGQYVGLSAMLRFGTKLGNLKVEKQTPEGSRSYTIGKKCYFLPNCGEYGDDDEIFDDPGSHKGCQARCADMRMSGIPIYNYCDGRYRFVVSPKHYQEMLEGKQIDYSWNKLRRDLERLEVQQVEQSRVRGYVGKIKIGIKRR